MVDNTRPNVVFILTDDQGPWAAHVCGNDEIRTPHIDRLAEAGVRFENFFCTSPVCSPARASLMTGRIPSQHGVHDWIYGGNMPPDPQQYLEGLTCYTDVLAANGYACGLSGKWHLGDSLSPQHGFRHWFTLPKGSSEYNDATVIRDGETVTAPGYLTDVITDDALGFIERQKAGPFYLSVNYTAPHRPFTGHPQDIVDSYDDCPFKTCPQEAAHPWALPRSRQFLGNREALKGYFAAVTAMDLGVGRIVDRLDALGLRQNTLVIFSSDNGYSCGHHGFWHKGNGTFPINMYENSVKVPAIFSHPSVLPAGKVTSAMVSQYDFMPTLLELLGLPALDDATLPGGSFVGVLRGETDEAREDVVVYDEYGPVRMIRTPEWKYVHRHPFGPHELYDMVADPDERKNLYGEKSRQPVVTEMRTRLAGWFARYVIPRLDGSRLPVWGDGQLRRIDDDCCGENAFQERDQNA
ncbi:MAG TPA: sulfatase-like hydrolase/transferase [Planctomycetota bacterium]|nr:sulfatase-like hydrolase/transferase [Planctomycetota bacterium]